METTNSKKQEKGAVMINEKYIRFDWAVKRMLRDKANFDVLEGLITVLLGEKITIVELLESEGNQEAEDDKFNRVDIKAKDSNGIIIIELIIAKDLFTIEKILYGTAKTITAHIPNYKYNSDSKVFSIIISYYNLNGGNWYFQQGYRNSINYRFLMVPRFTGIATTPIEEWLDYLKNGRIKDDTTTPGLAEAREKLQYMQMSRADQLAYERHLDALAVQSDAFDAARIEGHAEGRAVGIEEGRAAGIEEGRAAGIEEGRVVGLEEGRTKEKKDIARNLKSLGVSVNDISKATSLTIEEIEAL